ncbi:MATE family efflux transporter [Microbacteriaceae bacterium VKM Ac-2855]|nr:MATE family efflux transporter [Microbacteriaceae bacterium VKM Ac-2855]
MAVPALGSLVAEPLFLLTDSALIGHLGTTPLAGLAIGAAVVQTIVGLMVFLAYSTTPLVARAVGAGDTRAAVAAGIDGGWLALGLGAVLAVVGAVTAGPVVALFGPEADVGSAAVTYLGISMAGVPAMLGVFALTGLLRGLQDTRTPLVVTGVGFVANAGLNAVLIYPAGLGIAGSALGTVIAQWTMLLVYAVLTIRLARRHGAPIRPHPTGVLRSAGSGSWLLLRTASLRAAMLLAVAVATGLGSAELGSFQIAMTLFSTVAFALDAVAIAAQALLGKHLGAGDPATARNVTNRCIRWGIGSGAVLGCAVTALSGFLPVIFTTDPVVKQILPPIIVIVGLTAPLGGYVFVLDGVLIGAGDGRYLALSGLVNLAVFVPLALLAPRAPEGLQLVALWLAFAVGYLGARALTLGLRARSDVWLR